MQPSHPKTHSRVAIVFAIVVFGLAAGSAGADTGVPLYVAQTGTDTGDCSAAEAPCRTLGFALSVASKNAQIRVAGGSYAITDPADALYIVSGAIDVQGGYVPAGAAVNDGRSTLTGVPLELRDALRARGFHVIVDQKANADERDARTNAMLHHFLQAQVSAPAAPCVGGTAAGFSCNAVDLLAHVARADISANPAEAMDVWGFVDLNTHREYVFVGVTVGTAVFDVTDPTNPAEVGFVDGQAANWRDIKVYQHFDASAQRWRAYAYVTTDGASDGLFVIDLNELPHTIVRSAYATDFNSAHNVYVTNTDFATGVRQSQRSPHLIIAGSGIDAGQFRSYSLDDAASPPFVQRVNGADYMHDAASVILEDARTGQCAGSPARCDILVDFNEEHLEVWDFNDPSAPNRLAQVDYTNVGYVHSGWWSEDKRYVYVHDELDERQVAGLPTTVRVFSMADLTNPTLVGSYTGTTSAIDHNGFVRGNRYYMSNYTRGLTILDITDPSTPTEVGRFDTFGANDATAFAGAWGAYPFLPSGTVAVSDINSGLYLLADRTRDVAAGSVGFAAPSFAVQEGSPATLTLTRTGGTAGAISVDIDVLATTTNADDFNVPAVTVSWADGDAAEKTLTIDAIADSQPESLEHAIVRIVNPSGGATLAATNVTNLFISDAGATPEFAALAENIDVTERGFGRAIVVVQRTGDAQSPASLDYAVGGGDAVLNDDYTGAASGTLSWPAGDGLPKSIAFDIVDDNARETDEFFEVTFSNPQGASVPAPLVARITIQDGSGSNTAPNAVAGANQTVPEGALVTLDGVQSNDPDGDVLSYAWTQTGGPAVTLQTPAAAATTFTAPLVSSDTLLQFRLVVSDPGGLANSATVSVTVTNGGAAILPGGGGRRSGGSGAPAWTTLLILLFATARRVVQCESRTNRMDFVVRSSARDPVRWK